MIVLIEVLCFILFVVCVCLFALHKINVEEIRELNRKLKAQENELKNINSKIKGFEIRFMNLATDKEKIEIYHKYDDTGAPDYPNSRGA